MTRRTMPEEVQSGPTAPWEDPPSGTATRERPPARPRPTGGDLGSGGGLVVSTALITTLGGLVLFGALGMWAAFGILLALPALALLAYAWYRTPAPTTPPAPLEPEVPAEHLENIDEPGLTPHQAAGVKTAEIIALLLAIGAVGYALLVIGTQNLGLAVLFVFVYGIFLGLPVWIASIYDLDEQDLGRRGTPGA